MVDAKPITLTQQATEDYEGGTTPKPVIVVGTIPGAVTAQAAPTLTAVPGSFADVAAVRTYLLLLVADIQDIINGNVAAGVFED